MGSDPISRIVSGAPRGRRVLIAYATVDGHTGRIADRLRELLQAAGHVVTLARIGAAPIDVDRADVVVLGSSIRYGKHQPELLAFVERSLPRLLRVPSAFFSVNLVARKPGKDTAATNPYVRAFLRQSAWRPRLTAVFGGKLDYARYGLVDRHVIRLIMLLTGGPTDPRACVDYTDWGAVAAFAERIAALAARPATSAGRP